jgi:hypothetical protein
MRPSPTVANIALAWSRGHDFDAPLHLRVTVLTKTKDLAWRSARQER